MIARPERDHCRVIAGHVACDYARDKVARALYESVVEALEFGPRDLPRLEDREWIRGAIAIPLQEATDAALQVLTRSLTRTLARAPEGLLDRFERSNHLADLGIE
ncbi:MAG TPA: hypothetical protein VFY18_03235 [Candidatus Limnocylindrales bacterium]|nr:hypothetical protein [Candidatus Limnocylindrales bacterium]